MTKTSQKVKYITVSSMLSALAVVVLALGSLIDTMDLSIAAIAGIFCYYAVLEIGGIFPYLIYLVTSTLGILLIPNKSPAVLFLAFFGIYPILKPLLEKLNKILSYVIKFVLFHFSVALAFGISYLFFPSIIDSWKEDVSTKAMWVILYLLALVVFVLYDYCFTLFARLYESKFKKYLHIK